MASSHSGSRLRLVGKQVCLIQAAQLHELLDATPAAPCFPLSSPGRGALCAWCWRGMMISIHPPCIPWKPSLFSACSQVTPSWQRVGACLCVRSTAGVRLETLSSRWHHSLRGQSRASTFVVKLGLDLVLGGPSGASGSGFPNRRLSSFSRPPITYHPFLRSILIPR